MKAFIKFIAYIIGSIFLLVLLLFIAAIPEIASFMNEYFGFITTMAIIIAVIYILITYK